MKKTLLHVVALTAGMAMTGVASADYFDSSADAGLFDDATPFSSTIVVPVNEIITDLTVTINMDHSWVGDVTATLTNGTQTIELIPTALFDSSNLGFDSGGDTLSPAPYTWSNAGLATIGTAAAGGNSTYEIPSGTYLPSDGTATGAGSFAATFGGLSTLGSWTINLSDSADGDDGHVNGWSINFTSNPVPEPSSLTLLGLLGVAAVVRRRR